MEMATHELGEFFRGLRLIAARPPFALPVTKQIPCQKKYI